MNHRRRIGWRYPVVLLVTLGLAVVEPLTYTFIEEQGVFDAVCSVLIFAVMLLIFDHPRERTIAIPLGIVALITLWISIALEGPGDRLLLVISHLLTAGFLGFALYGIVAAIFLRRVTENAMLGVFCGYMLLGIVWTLLFTALETASPGSFRTSGDSSTIAVNPDGVVDLSTLNYFSFVTLCTVGYGDITPVTPLARTLSWLEALIGQFYLGVLVAGLVGMKVTQALEQGKSLTPANGGDADLRNGMK